MKTGDISVQELKEYTKSIDGTTIETRAVQEHLGHTTIAMTQRYSHLSRDFQREEVNRLNGLCGENGKKLVRNEDLVRNEADGQINAPA